MSLEESILKLEQTIQKLISTFEADYQHIGDDADFIKAMIEEETERMAPVRPINPKEQISIEADIPQETRDEKVDELIALSQEMGYPYQQLGDKLLMDNRVLNEFNRRVLGDEV